MKIFSFGYNDLSLLPKEYIDLKQELNISRKINSRYVPTKGDKMYFFPGCKVPRFKIKQYCEKYGVRPVRDRSKANVFFVNKNEINKIAPIPDVVSVPVKELLTLNLKGDIYNELREFLITTKDPDVYFSSHYYLGRHLGGVPSSSHEYIYTKDDIDTVIALGNGNTYYDTEVSGKLSTYVITETEYLNLKRMFESSDPATRDLAIETIANSDYDRSAFYLLLLLKAFYSRIKSSNISNTVNFTSFLQYFGFQKSSAVYSFSYETLGKKLIERNLLTAVSAQKIISFVRDEVEHEFYTSKEYEYSEMVINAINSNILDVDCDCTILDYEHEQLALPVD